MRPVDGDASLPGRVRNWNVVTADGDDEFQRIYVSRSATADNAFARALQQEKGFWSDTQEGGSSEVRLAQGEHWTQEPAAPAQQL
jgi:hypothetical protein